MADDQIKNAERLADLQSQEEIRLKNITKAEEARSVVLQNQVGMLKEMEKAVMALQAAGDDALKAEEQAVEAANGRLQTLLQIGTASKEEIEYARTLLGEAENQLTARQELRDVSLDAITEERTGREKILEKHEKELELKDKLNSKTQQILSAMTGIDDMAKNTVIGQFFATAQAIGFVGALAQVGAAMKSVFTMTNILGSAGIGLAFYLMKNAYAAEAARAEFNATTAAAGAFDAQIVNSTAHMKSLGMDTKDYANALGSLRNNISFFADLPDHGDALAKLNAQMGKLGVDQAALNSLQEFEHTLGGGNVEEFTLNLLGASKAIGMDLNKVVANASQHMNKFAVYGDRAKEVFIGMQSHAKKLGAEISDLTDITDQYNTVSGSIAAAAKLNMALGGAYINANKMRGLSDEQRIVEIKRAIEASGQSIETMSVESKRRFIQLSGIKNEALALKMLGKTKAEELKKASDGAIAATASQDELNKATESSLTPMQKLATLFSDLLAVVKPIIDGLHWVADGMKSIFGGGFWAGLGTMASLWAGYKLAVWAVVAAKTAFMTRIIGLWPWQVKSAATTALDAGAQKDGAVSTELNNAAKLKGTPITQAFGAAASMSAGQILAMGAALLFAAIGIGIIVGSLALLAMQMKEMSVGQMAMFTGVIITIGLVLKMLIPVFAANAAAASAAAGAFTLLAIAASMAAPGVVALGLGMLLFAIGFAVVMILMPMFAIFVGLVASLTVLAPLMVAAGSMVMVGLMMMSFGLLSLGLALKFVSSRDLESLGNMMMGLGMVAANMGAGISSAVPTVRALMNTLRDLGTGTIYGAGLGMEAITDAFLMLGMSASIASWGVEELADAMEAIPESKVTAFTQMFETVTDNAPAVQALTPTAIGNVTKLVDEAFRFNSALMIGGMFGGASAFVEALGATTGTTTPTKGGGASSAETPPVIFEIDGREIGKVVEKYINKKNKLPTKVKSK